MVTEYESRVIENFMDPFYMQLDIEECTVSHNNCANQNILSKELRFFGFDFASDEKEDTYSDTKENFILLRFDSKEDLSTKDKSKKTEENYIESKTGQSRECTFNQTIQMIQPQSKNDEAERLKKDPFKEFEKKVCFNHFSRPSENANAEEPNTTSAFSSFHKSEFNSSDINYKDESNGDSFSSKSFSHKPNKKIFTCRKKKKILSFEKFSDMVESENPSNLHRLLADVEIISDNDQLSVCRSQDSIDKKNKTQPRKYDFDSINKKLKTDSLNLLSTLLGGKDFLFEKDKKHNSIKSNKDFNQMFIKTLILEELNKKYKFKSEVEMNLRKIKENLNIKEILMMTFAEYFNKIYLASNHFKNKLRENSTDVVYLRKLIQQADNYVEYFEKNKPNETQNKIRKKENFNQSLSFDEGNESCI